MPVYLTDIERSSFLFGKTGDMIVKMIDATCSNMATS
jgi:hypothetical protein